MPYFALNSLSVGTESTLIGSTTTPFPVNASKSSEKEHISAVHVLVKASGKKAISTLDFPANCVSDTFSPDVDDNVKSGARSPTIGVGALETADAVTEDLLQCAPTLGRASGRRLNQRGALL